MQTQGLAALVNQPTYSVQVVQTAFKRLKSKGAYKNFPKYKGKVDFVEVFFKKNIRDKGITAVNKMEMQKHMGVGLPENQWKQYQGVLHDLFTSAQKVAEAAQVEQPSKQFSFKLKPEISLKRFQDISRGITPSDITSEDIVLESNDEVMSNGTEKDESETLPDDGKKKIMGLDPFVFGLSAIGIIALGFVAYKTLKKK